MRYIFLLFAVAFTFQFYGCKESPQPEPEPLKTFMLAILERAGEIPLDFEADEAIGDFKPETGLLRIEGTDMWNGKDKIELTIRDVEEIVTGDYTIGHFDQANTRVRAQFIDGQHVWDARSTSGTLTITKFEAAESPNAFLLSATFSFEAEAQGGKVNITNGEIENAVILQ